MELTTRQIVAEDYDKILVDWWIAWGWKPPVRDFLPNNGTGGIIVYDGETPVCAGFVYVTNSKVCWVDWVISNKDYKKKNPGSNLQTAVTEKNPTGKRKSRQKSFCARSRGWTGPRGRAARARWNC